MMTMELTRNFVRLMPILLGVLLLTSCKKDEDEPPGPSTPPPNEEEVITTLILTFTDAENNANVYELRFTDLDGDGGNDPVITTDILPQGRAFSVALRLLNESVNPAVEITNEISAEDDEHQFFFAPSNVNLTMTYNDQDGNGNPVGLQNTAVTGAPSLGSMIVTLRHQPDKSAAGVAQGDITNAGGETDIEVTFPVRVD
jgi:hypothetical protein